MTFKSNRNDGISLTWPEPSTPAAMIGTRYSHSSGRGTKGPRAFWESPCNSSEPTVPTSSRLNGFSPVTPSIAWGNIQLREIGIKTIISATPMRKSRRMNAHPISETHKNSALTSAMATTPPHSTPNSAMATSTPALRNTEGVVLPACGTLSAADGESSTRHQAIHCGNSARRRASAILRGQLNGIEHSAHDARTGIVQCPDRARGIRDTGVILAHQHNCTARAERNALRIGIQTGRRCIEQNDVEFIAQFTQQRGQGGPEQQLLRIRRARTRRQQRKRAELRKRHYGVSVSAAREHRGQTNAVGYIEDAMLPGCAQIRVNQDCAFAELRKCHGKISCNVTAPFP